jgi:hypothetical protein
MFAPSNRLSFDLAALIENAIIDWYAIKPMGFNRPIAESAGDAITAEMDARGLRFLKGEEAWFNREATSTEYKECVFAALDRWLVQVEINLAPTAERMDEYNRPCGE